MMLILTFNLSDDQLVKGQFPVPSEAPSGKDGAPKCTEAEASPPRWPESRKKKATAKVNLALYLHTVS